MAERVSLHVYDISQGMARALSQQFLGVQLDIVPHTGIVVFGKEYFFSGGIQSLPKEQFASMYMPTCQVVDLGETEVPLELFEEFLAERAPAYTMQTYNLLRHNCNHFTEGESKRKRRAAGRMRSDSDACVIHFLRGRRVRAVPRRHLHPRLDSRRARHRPSYSDRSAVCSDV